MGEAMHPAENELVCKSITKDKIPHFNANIYLQDKTKIGKVEEIFGPIKDFGFSLKLDSNVKAKSLRVVGG